jgi:hypothetical protein
VETAQGALVDTSKPLYDAVANSSASAPGPCQRRCRGSSRPHGGLICCEPEFVGGQPSRRRGLISQPVLVPHPGRTPSDRVRPAAQQELWKLDATRASVETRTQQLSVTSLDRVGRVIVQYGAPVCGVKRVAPFLAQSASGQAIPGALVEMATTQSGSSGPNFLRHRRRSSRSKSPQVRKTIAVPTES